jgi:hypothetical protein
MPFQYLGILFSAALPYQFPLPVRYLAPHDRLAVLRCPHQMQVNLEYRVRPVSVAHLPNLLHFNPLAEAVA